MYRALQVCPFVAVPCHNWMGSCILSIRNVRDYFPVKEVLMKLQGICIGLFLVLLISGCASGQTGQGSATDPTLLQVVRVNTNRYMIQYPPLKETIRDTGVVQRIYQEAHMLPPPAGKSSCPVATGSLIYRLSFFHGKTLLQEMNLGVLDCQYLWLSTTDLRVPDSNFLHLLSQALHLNSLIPQN